uniref:Large ribosomal subunit protein eL24 n=1 Tax=Paramormyrops kingsleyae TaxID=1676925 RepID=A0A3B3RRX1_9TELE|nr:60S ribosomal protein L24-like [Paramormyrops kingsleyae]
MKVELCSFSGYKIYPGHGRRYARIDGKVFQFLNAKCESAFLAKRNPRQINWTVLYRRKHKKGQSEEVTKKRTRRAVKCQRAITGASLAEILAKRNQKPEVRKALREQAIRAAKEAKKAKQATKKQTAVAAKVRSCYSSVNVLLRTHILPDCLVPLPVRHLVVTCIFIPHQHGTNIHV